MRRKKKKKNRRTDLRKATPAQVVEAFNGELTLLSLQPNWKGRTLTTGLKSLNRALGIGGLPRGRMIEVFGPESSGKTSLCLKIIAEAQKAGGKGAYIDAEHALDIDHATQLGVNVDELLLSQPDSAEGALDLAFEIIKTKAADVVVVDSVSALVPLAELGKESLSKMTMGRQAELMSRALRKINPRIRKSGVLLIFVNQIRMKIGVMFGDPETTSGGRALRFYASIRMRVSQKGQYKKKGKLLGMDTRVRIVKNKVARPFEVANLRLIFGKGWKSIKD